LTEQQLFVVLNDLIAFRRKLFLLKKFKRKPLVELKSIALNESGALWKLVVNELHRHADPMKAFFAVFVLNEVDV
jgi:hypothetical protein